MKIRLRLEARADLEHIHAHIARDDPAAANAVIGRIEKAVERAILFPSSGRREAERVNNGIPGWRGGAEA